MTRLALGAVALTSLATLGASTVHFKETFDDKWKSRWVESTNWKPKGEMGEWKHTQGKWFGESKDKAIQTGEDARFYGISAKLAKPFSNDGKDLVLQYSVKHEQDIDCGGAYIKLMGPGVDQSKFGGDSPYQVMFGPDICGSTKRTHVIFHYPPKNDNLLIKEDVRCESDQLTHLYTLHIKAADNSFDVYIDGEKVRSGKLEEAWDFLLPRTIKDPNVSKPQDWVDTKEIPDPADKKPAGWDDIPAQIPDPEAAKPGDWDDEEDGEWEAPLIDNPDYKGDWRPKMIPNPAYKGEWVHPEIANPDFKDDAKLHLRAKDVTYVGFELWQVKSGTLFDDIIVTDNLAEAEAFAKDTFHKKKDGEKAMFDKIEAERQEKEKAEREEAMKKAQEKAEDVEDEEEDEEEDEDDGFKDEL